MKKLFLLILVFISIQGFSQAPKAPFATKQTIGSKGTLVTSTGGLKSDSALIGPVFLDTISANLGPNPKYYPGNMIRIVDTLYFRSNDTTKWIKIGSTGGGGSDGLGLLHVVGDYGLNNVNDSTLKLDTTLAATKAYALSLYDILNASKLNKSDSTALNGYATQYDLTQIAVPSLQQVTDIGFQTTHQLISSANGGFTVVDGSAQVSAALIQVSSSGGGNLDLRNTSQFKNLLYTSEDQANNNNVMLPNTGNTSDTLFTFYDFRNAGGGSVGSTETLTNVGSEFNLVKPLSGSNYDIKTLKAGINMILDSATANKIIFHADTTAGDTKLATQGFVTRNAAASFTETNEEFTGTDLLSYDGTTGFVVTVSNTPLTTKARTVFVNGLLLPSSYVGISGAVFTITDLPYSISTSDIITVKYSY